MRRRVTATKKNEDNTIAALCNPGSSWSPIESGSAIIEIDLKLNEYFVMVGNEEVNIHVVDGENGKHLRTDPDKTDKNNLLELPDC